MSKKIKANLETKPETNAPIQVPEVKELLKLTEVNTKPSLINDIRKPVQQIIQAITERIESKYLPAESQGMLIQLDNTVHMIKLLCDRIEPVE
jgi:hypothetical protein